MKGVLGVQKKSNFSVGPFPIQYMNFCEAT
jgi:hypothetical protein